MHVPLVHHPNPILIIFVQHYCRIFSSNTSLSNAFYFKVSHELSLERPPTMPITVFVLINTRALFSRLFLDFNRKVICQSTDHGPLLANVGRDSQDASLAVARVALI